LIRRLKRALLLAILAVLAALPGHVLAAHRYPSAWYACRITLTPDGTFVQHRVCHTYPIHRAHRPIVGWTITRHQVSRRLITSVRYPRFQAPPPPPVDVSSRARPYVGPWLSAIAAASHETGVPTRVIAAIMMVETRGQHTCSSGDMLSVGLMQVQPATAVSMWQMHGVYLSVATAASRLCNDPTFDVVTGAYYLQYQFSRYGSWYTAAGAYNAGSWTGATVNYTYANQFEYWYTG
jgi:hypothetical protein